MSSRKEHGPTGRTAGVGWIVVALSTGTALSALNSGMIAVALSTLRGEFHVDVPTVTWVISAYYLASAALQPLMGRLADRYGALRVFTIGMVIVAVAGAAGPFAPTLEWLCAVRVVLAIGTATAFPSAAAMLRRLARERSADAADGSAHSGSFEAAPVIGRIQLIDTSAAAVGPVLGGALLLIAGWEAIFWINIPLAALAVVATRLVIPRDEPREHVPLRTTLRESDLPGVVLFAVTIVGALPFLLDVVDGAEWQLLAIAVLAGALFTWRELRAATPFVDLRLLAGNTRLLRVYGLFILANLVLYGTLFGIPQYLEDYAGFGTAAVGAMLLPLAAFNAVLARPIERLITSRGHRLTLLIGVGGLVVSTAALLLLTLSTAPWAVLLVMAAIGIPYAFVLISLTQSLYLAAPPEHVGQAAGLFQTARSLGSIAGATVVGMSLFHGTDPEDWIILAAVLAASALIFAVFALSTGRTARTGLGRMPADAAA